METGHTQNLARVELQFLHSTGPHPMSGLKGNEHNRKHRGKKNGARTPESKVGNLGVWVEKKMEQKERWPLTVPSLFSHTLGSRAPGELAGPSPGNLVKVSKSLHHWALKG